jgi:hypothetical protein
LDKTKAFFPKTNLDLSYAQIKWNIGLQSSAPWYC